MLSMNGIIILELILGGVLMSLVFGLFPNTDLIADSSPKPTHEPEPDSVGTTMKPDRARTEISCLMYMSVLAGDYYLSKATAEAAVSIENI
jgi:hypothetical protein